MWAFFGAIYQDACVRHLIVDDFSVLPEERCLAYNCEVGAHHMNSLAADPILDQGLSYCFFPLTKPAKM